MAKLPLKAVSNAGGLDRFKRVYFKRLNDVHLGTQLTLRSLMSLGETIVTQRKKSPYHHFVVPSGGTAVGRIRRDPKQMAKLIEKLVANDECAKALLLCVGISEDYLHNVMRMMLRAYPERLAHGPKGGASDPPITLDDLLVKGRDEIIDERIRLRLHRVLHAKPTDYLSYLSAIVQLKIDDETVGKFSEAKATRDVIVHGNGRANEIYIEKAGLLARAANGQRLDVGQPYFDACVATMKRLIGEINDGLTERCQGDASVLSAADRFFS